MSGGSAEEGWKPVFAQFLARLHVVTGKRRRSWSGAVNITGVIAYETQRKGTSPGVAGVASCTVQNFVVKRYGIAGLHRPFADVHTFGIRVGHRHVFVFIGVKAGF